MGRLSQEDIEKILSAADIVSVVGDYVKLTKRGVNHFGCCPFHDEKTPSMSVSQSKGIFKCFGCGKGGDVITFVQEVEHIPWHEAARQLAKRYNVEIAEPEMTAEERHRELERESVMNALRAAQKWYQDRLIDNSGGSAVYKHGAGAEYLKKRGVDLDTLEAYGVGMSGETWHELYDALKVNYSDDTLYKAGLLAYSEAYRSTSDFFRNRIMLPYYSRSGQIIGFTGRLIPSEATKDVKMKYQNTGETMLFKKGNVWYGLHQAKSEMARTGRVYVVEGQFDVLSWHQHGLKNVIAKSGSAMSNEQVKQVRQLCGEVTLAYDDDTAGIHATIDNMPKWLDAGMGVRCVMLPEGMDPDDLARQKGADLPMWVKNNEKSLAYYLYKKMVAVAQDAIERDAAISRVRDLIGHVQSEGLRKAYWRELCELAGEKDMAGAVPRQVKKSMQETSAESLPTDKAFAGLDELAEIYDRDEMTVRLTSSWEEFSQGMGVEPVVYVRRAPMDTEVQELRKIDNAVEWLEPDSTVGEKGENIEVETLKSLYKAGFSVTVVADCCGDGGADAYVESGGDVTDYRGGGGEMGFITWYVWLYGNLIRKEHPTADVTDMYLERVAEMMAEAPEITRTRCMKEWAAALKLPSEKALRDIVKPFLSRKRAQNRVQHEREQLDDVEDVDGQTLPDYVENNEEYSRMNSRFGFYPLLSKSKGEPVCYMFKNDSGGYGRVCDFYMEPLLHIYDEDPELNKRIMKLTSMSSDIRKPKYVAWKSSVLANMAAFKTQLLNAGAYNFENGNVKHFDKIVTYMSHQFKRCKELHVYGQQKKGFFAFTNAIFHKGDGGQWEVTKMDNLGLVAHDGELYYSPVYSEIYADDDDEQDRFEQDRWLTYTDVAKSRQITFEKWAELFDKVYKINDNGKWALIYSIMCAYRSVIYPICRAFTALFFVGQTSSGKSQIAVSIRSLYEKPEAPAAKLDNISDAAFFSVLERFRDVPFIFDEYNDESISFEKFQGLKATVYDGDGKQKRKSATTNDVESSKVNAPIILLGQESPQKDDAALANRIVLCEVPAYRYIEDEEATRVFKELKGYEKEGLSYLLTQVLELRPLFIQKFEGYWNACTKALISEVGGMGGRSGDVTRVCNTVSMFLATMKLMEQDASHLKLPFTYDEFFSLAVDKVKRQVEMISKTDKLAVFFQTMEYLIDKGSLKINRDFKIEQPGTVTLAGGEMVRLASAETKVVYMNLSNIHKYYLTAMHGDKPLTMTTLSVNLKSHPAYIGQVKGCNFVWMERREVPRQAETETNEFGTVIARQDMEMRVVMEKMKKNTSAVVLDYDELVKFLGVDFEREYQEEDWSDDKPF